MEKYRLILFILFFGFLTQKKKQNFIIDPPQPHTVIHKTIDFIICNDTYTRCGCTLARIP